MIERGPSDSPADRPADGTDRACLDLIAFAAACAADGDLARAEGVARAASLLSVHGAAWLTDAAESLKNYCRHARTRGGR